MRPVLLRWLSLGLLWACGGLASAKAADANRLTYLDVLQRNLKVMDSTAISLCRDNKLDIVVFDLGTRGNIRRVVQGESIGTLVSDEESRPW